MELQYSRVDMNGLPQLWPFIYPLVKNYLRDSLTTTPEHMYAQIMTQQKTLWICHDKHNPDDMQNIVVTEFVAYDVGLWMCVHGCAVFEGKELNLPFLHDFFTVYGKSANCVGYEIIGRAGWQRKLPELRMEGVVLRTTFTA